MVMYIKESGMIFGPFSEEHCFHIEKTNIYLKLQTGLQMAEFILMQPDKESLLVVEAKSSSPRPTNKIDFDEYIAEIAEKLMNGFTLGLAVCLGRPGRDGDEISQCFKEIAHNSVRVKLVLVINGHKDEWLTPINDALKNKLRCISKIWPLDIITINEIMARKYHLIQATA